MRHSIAAFVFVLAAGLLLNGDLSAGSLEPPGSPAPTMKTLSEVEPRTPISSLPVTIAASGSYYLTGNLTGVAGQTGITITSSFVTLDLNGFSLIGVTSSNDGIMVVGGIKQVVIRNGVIRNWASGGISALSATEVRAEDLRVDGNGGAGLLLGSGSIVRNTTSSRNGGTGVFVDVGGTIIECTATSNGSEGLSTNGASRIVHSVARLNTIGISAAGAGASIEQCTAEANTDDGIRVGTEVLVRGNVTHGNSGDGIQVSGNGNRIEDNDSTTNAIGIRVSVNLNVIVRNRAYANTTAYSIVAGNKVGTISPDPATAGPWANF